MRELSHLMPEKQLLHEVEVVLLLLQLSGLACAAVCSVLAALAATGLTWPSVHSCLVWRVASHLCTAFSVLRQDVTIRIHKSDHAWCVLERHVVPKHQVKLTVAAVVGLSVQDSSPATTWCTDAAASGANQGRF